MKDLRFRPRPLQQPRIPIWVVAGWRSERSLARALRWDGMIPQRLGGEDPLTPAEIAELTSYAGAHRAANGRFEVVVEGLTTGRAPSELERVQAYADAGVTWWLEGLWLYIYETPGDAEVIRRWIGAGPPRPTQA